MIELHQETLRDIYKVLDLEILGEVGFTNIMTAFETKAHYSNDGFLTESGFTSLMNIKENCAKILMWESLE